MKILHWFASASLVVVAIISVAVAQDAPKRADAIEVVTALTDSLLIEQSIALLDAQGYTIDRVDAKRGTFSTAHKSAGGASMRVLGSVQRGVLTLRGQWSVSAGGWTFTNEPAINKGLASGGSKSSFQDLDKLARKITAAIDGATLRYTVGKAS